MEIKETILPFIEQALEIKLYDDQKHYLLDSVWFGPRRRGGKTLAYCIKLALTEEELYLGEPEAFADTDSRDPHLSKMYARHIFLREFLTVHKKLKDYGFKVATLVEKTQPIMRGEDYIDEETNQG